MLIRYAADEDARALTSLFTAWHYPQPEDAIRAQLKQWNDTSLAAVLLAEIDQAVVGVVAVAATPYFHRLGLSGRIIGLAVSDSARRRGVGKRLIDAAESCALGWGCDRLEVTSSRNRREAPAFYTSLGFEDQSERQARYLRPVGRPD